MSDVQHHVHCDFTGSTPKIYDKNEVKL
jgi:hypothetical protein